MVKKLFTFFGICLILVQCAPFEPAENNPLPMGEEQDLPNIVYIFTDDLGYGDLSCFGAPDIQTPNIDRLAREGMKFTDFYSASHICSPSRAALLTGRLPQRMGIHDVFFPESFTGMSPDEFTIAELLKQADYATGFVGKWHLGHHHQYLPLQQGFDEYFGIPYSNDMESVVYMRQNEVVSHHVDQRYTVKNFTVEATEFIRNHRGEPFFLFVSHSMPHVPLYVSDSFLGSSDRGLYGDVIQEIDWSVGEIIKHLDLSGILDNTLLIFSSDNGPWLAMQAHGGSPGILREGKHYTFEGGMRVPTLAMWKNTILPGTTYSGPASQMDLLPTISSMTGISLPDGLTLDGMDISGVLEGSGTRGSDIIQYFDGGELQAYRNGRWKIKRPFEGFAGADWKKGVPAHDSLMFDLAEDPGETQNLFHTHTAKARQLFAEMDSSLQKLGRLPRALMIRTPADRSHYEYLNEQ